MLPEGSVNADRVWKRFRGDRHRSLLRDEVQRLRSRRHGGDQSGWRWAVQDVSLQVAPGQSTALIGSNGSGKSTMLKMLVGVMYPYAGRIATSGRIGALIEVRAGIHPDLTARENVYMYGNLLGIPRKAVGARFDEIISFAGLEDAVDRQVKFFSSGMSMRLGFAVASFLDPAVLIVDEVLAVGDAEFQRKSLAGMSKVGAAGKTVVLVSHDLDAIGRLCSRTIWLDRGRLRMDGPTADVIDAYLASTREDQDSATEIVDDRGRATLHGVHVIDRAGQPTTLLRRDAPVRLAVDLSVHERTPGLDIAVFVLNQRGVRVLDEVWSDTAEERPSGPGRYVVSLEIPPVLNVGQYSVGVWIGQGFDEFFSVDAAASFVLDGNSKGRPDRIVELLVPWTYDRGDQPH